MKKSNKMKKINSKLPLPPNGEPVLLTPGPLTTSLKTKESMLLDVGSWDEDFKKLSKEILCKLENILLETSTLNSNLKSDPYKAIPMQGSGTFSVEAMLGTFIPKNGKALVLSNGAYGLRCYEILKYLDRSSDIIDMGDFLPPNPSLVEKKLKQDPNITHVIIIHCETSSGILNPISPIAKIVEDNKRSLLIDSMSAFGGIPIDAGKIKFDALVSSANKCIEGVPGFGFVLVKKSILEDSKNQSHSLSLDLFKQWEYMENSGQWRFTPPTHSLLAFASSLMQHENEGGVLGRLFRYEKNKNKLVSGMQELGFETLLSKRWLSPIIVSFLFPDHSNFHFNKLYSLMKSEGFLIYPGKLTATNTFRIGCIGQVDEFIMGKVTKSIKKSLKIMGIKSASPNKKILLERDKLDKLLY